MLKASEQMRSTRSRFIAVPTAPRTSCAPDMTRWSGGNSTVYVDVGKALKVDFRMLRKHNFLLTFSLKIHKSGRIIFSPYPGGLSSKTPGMGIPTVETAASEK